MKKLSYPVITKTEIPGFKLHSRGKVRDIYEIDPETLLIITTDRMSAFDVILSEAIPWKGVVLNQITLFWMDRFRDLVPNHILETDIRNYPAALLPYEDQLVGRSVLVRKAQPLKAECIVRGYLAGSGWKSYCRNKQLCGHALPDGLVESSKLPEVLFTPSTKGELGTHDENISLDKMREIVGADLADQAAGLTLKTENIEAFREKLDRVVRENSDPACFDQVKEYDLVLPFRTWTPAALTRLSALEPSGCGNPPPVFLLTGVSVLSFSLLYDFLFLIFF